MPEKLLSPFKESLLGPAFAFERKSLELFRFQAGNNAVYQKYIKFLKVEPERVQSIENIPFLPVEFYKYHSISSANQPPETVFESSGTTSQTRSRHYVHDTGFYRKVARRIFGQAYGPLTDYHVVALLPSYTERSGSSLVYMVADFIRESGSPESGFFLEDRQKLVETIEKLRKGSRKVLLIGVTFALLDLAEDFGGRDWHNVIVMETGGMKGRRKELLREEVHQILKRAFNLPAVHSEYGMTEMLSQAYSTGNGVFQMPATLRVLIRDINDPFSIGNRQRSGGVNIIDLANADSCAFIETKDIGMVAANGTFQILGRFDNSDVRGCNLLVG